MLQKFYNCFSIGVVVNGPLPAHERIGKYFQTIEEEECPINITLQILPAEELKARIARLTEQHPHHQTWGHPSLKYDVWLDGASQIMVPKSETEHLIRVSKVGDDLHINISSADVETLGRTATRIMRQLMLRNAEKVGGREGHGAAVVLNDKGIVLAGLPGAGKSTVAIALASQCSAGLVASDRLAFLPDRDGLSWTTAGIPVPWRIAAGTISGAAKLEQGLKSLERLYRGNQLVDGKLEFITSEVSAMLAVNCIFSIKLNTIVVLRRSQQISLRELHGDEKIQLTAQTLFNQPDQLFTNDWFGQFANLSELEKRQRGAKLARAVRVIEATWQEYSEINLLAQQIAALLNQN